MLDWNLRIIVGLNIWTNEFGAAQVLELEEDEEDDDDNCVLW